MPALTKGGECVVVMEFLGSLGARLGRSVRIRLHKPEVSLWELIRIADKLIGKSVSELVILKHGGGGPKLSPQVMVFINNVDARLLGGAHARISCNDKVAVIPVVHGG